MSELINELLIWEMRDKLDPPHKGLVMFSSSAAEYNTEHLVERWEVDESDCYEADYGGNDTLWIPLEVGTCISCKNRTWVVVVTPQVWPSGLRQRHLLISSTMSTQG